MTFSDLIAKARPTEAGCLIIGKPSAQRYWSVAFEGRTIGAHRVAYTLAKGIIPEGQVVRHKCDNTRCINPDHLELGTMADNMDDRDARGRNGTLGDNCPLSKLSEAAVLEIFNSQESNQALAAKYSVSTLTIHRIRKGITWGYVTSPAQSKAEAAR